MQRCRPRAAGRASPGARGAGPRAASAPGVRTSRDPWPRAPSCTPRPAAAVSPSSTGTGAAPRCGGVGARCDDGAMAGTPRFLTLADVAEVLNTSSAQVYALVRRGDLPAIKIGGRGQWRVEAGAARGVHPADVRRDAAVRRRAPVTRSAETPRARGPSAAAGSADLGVQRDRDGRAPSPSRVTVNSTVSPGWCARIATIRAMPSVTRWPSTAVTTSPFSQPGVARPGCRRRPRSISAPSPSSLRRSAPWRRSPGSAPRRSRRIWSAVILTCSIGIAKPTPMLPDSPPIAAAGGGDRGVHADHLAAQVDQRAAGVAGVDRGVGLHGVDVRRRRCRSRRWSPAGAAR